MPDPISFARNFPYSETHGGLKDNCTLVSLLANDNSVSGHGLNSRLTITLGSVITIKPNSDNPKSHLRGIAWMMVSGMLFVVVTGIVRHLGSELPAVQAAFLRYLIGLILLLPIIVQVYRNPSVDRSVSQYALRGLAHSIGVMLWFYAMARVPIAQVTALGFLTPVCVTIGAAIFLAEKLHFRRLAGIFFAVIGGLIIVNPTAGNLSWAVIAQLLAAPCFAASYLLAKKFSGKASADEIVVMLTIFCTLALFPGAWLQWQPPSIGELGWLGATAVAATLGHYTMTQALRAAPITLLQPFTFLQLVWATLLGVTLFGENASINIFIGAGLIVAASSYISHREYQLSKRSASQP